MDFSSNKLAIEVVDAKGGLTDEEKAKILNINRFWNFYNGYHWQEIEATEDQHEVTFNYCRVFADKMSSIEFGKGFSFTAAEEIENLKVADRFNVVQYLEKVWEENEKLKFAKELGLSKSVTGEAWIYVKYEPKGEVYDPFNEYPDGRIRLILINTNMAFPEFDVHDKERMVKLTIQYPIKIQKGLIFKQENVKWFKQIWTDTTVEEWEDKTKLREFPNPYGVIPFVLIKNISNPSAVGGMSDLEDLIPLNVEYNLKNSNVADILEYHAAPVTVLFGARASQLQKGANKMWSGLPKDAKVQNLTLDTDLGAAVNYINTIKEGIHEMGRVPEGVLGGSQKISNTSAVALSYANFPIVERLDTKLLNTKEGIKSINRLILFISMRNGLINYPTGISMQEFYNITVVFPDPFPKDMLTELMQISTEMKLGLENREGAMERLGKKDIQAKLGVIDKDRETYPELYGLITEQQLNSGEMNGQTPIEQVRTEVTGKNG